MERRAYRRRMAMDPEPVRERAAFTDVLCAVDGSRGSAEAVRQAIELIRPDGHVTFVAITDVRGVGANRAANVGEHRAKQSLAGARALARDYGLRCDTELVHAPLAAPELVAREAGHELLAIGSHQETRAGGVMVGSTATALAHRCTGPLLVARPAATRLPFPQRLVLATDGTRRDAPVAEIAMRIALARDAHIDIVHAADRTTDRRQRGEVGAYGAQLWDRTRREPTITEECGDPVELVTRVIARDEANLLIIGHGGRRGLRALGSVSERLVHRAGCSVLLVPT